MLILEFCKQSIKEYSVQAHNPREKLKNHFLVICVSSQQVRHICKNAAQKQFVKNIDFFIRFD